MAIKATVKSTSQPVVTKITQGAVSMASGISGLNINYSTVANNDVLAYDAASNTFVAQAAVSSMDGGEYSGGDF